MMTQNIENARDLVFRLRQVFVVARAALTALAFIPCALLTDIVPAAARFEQHTPGTTRNIIVFVHGLLGDKNTFVAKGGRPSWASLLEQDERQMRAGPPLSQYGTGYLLYETDANVYLSPKDISVRLTDTIVDAGIFDQYDNVFFICHSLGGLICKELFLHLQLRRPNDAVKVAGIFLFAVPSQGNPQVRWLQYIAGLAGASNTVLEGLKTIDINPALDALEKNWNYAMGGRQGGRPFVYCAYEKKPTPVAQVLPDVTVVSQIFATTRCDEPARPENEDHLSIVKPNSIAHSVYDWMRGRIGGIQMVASQSPARRGALMDVPIDIATTKPVFLVSEPIELNLTARRSSYVYCLLDDRSKGHAVILYPTPIKEFKAIIPRVDPIILNGLDFGYDTPAGFSDKEPSTTRFRCFASPSPMPTRQHARWLVQHVVERKARGVGLAVPINEAEARISDLLAHGAVEVVTNVRVISRKAGPP